MVNKFLDEFLQDGVVSFGKILKDSDCDKVAKLVIDSRPWDESIFREYDEIFESKRHLNVTPLKGGFNLAEKVDLNFIESNKIFANTLKKILGENYECLLKKFVVSTPLSIIPDWLKKISEKLVKDILNVYGYTSARVVIREDIDSEQLVDFLTGNKTYAKSITILNKIDLVDKKFLRKVSKKLKTKFIPVSANASDNIAELRDRIYDELQFIRIYLRPKGGETDYKEPLIIRNGNSVLDVCNKLHRKLRKDFRYGLVWGKSVKFGGQRVGLKHILIDEDVLTIIKTKGT